MNEVLSEYFSTLKMGKIQSHANMAVLPLVGKIEDSTYITLQEALESNSLHISEISQQGSVPELKVHNKGDIPVLLVDGEEVWGAKQNRVLNTSILLQEKSETIIPVSCTEQGRWSYNSNQFSDSGHVAASKIRRRKSASVSLSLNSCGEYLSNQTALWSDIEEISRDAQVESPTRALGDVYLSQKEDLNKYLEAFSSLDNQNGILVMINGEVVGLDIISSRAAYNLLHPKLVKSYALEAALKKDNSIKPEESLFTEFLDDLLKSSEEVHESVGYGKDHRFQSKNTIGSALIHNDKIIHTAFFKKERTVEYMESFSKRRRFRARR
ncbi:hypothetical protein HYG87_00915 [Methanobacterium alkalithermotolerans]|uniref:ARG and Rhodanese-Phosphatase-superfamily-associated domain-containing protein n=1 Tax=Methanobacterium alkalithermotolerans TaxID=2731220 RepID=A0A8T8K236_9EURY|nr:DUF6569 family protein [Methanobacterium alkalithermotolerans]QUH22424.1 hypothetical protein HYG87_00915 [Methanobacterium alkalithermotolerans]